MGMTDTMGHFWADRRVLITGHTGFKGAWLAYWLSELGAKVTGYALPPSTPFFDQLGLRDRIAHTQGDLRDAAALKTCVTETRPDVVFHLAAQSLVLESYQNPVGTWATNVLGSAHLLDALRGLENRVAVVMVTTDKVYANREWTHAYREPDRLGGHDPYSASKAAMEILIDSWRKSFGRSGLRIASARAGNVIGGGDWCDNRLVPDIARALAAGQPVSLRNPASVRPWQHVLEPLRGYVHLAERLFDTDDPTYADAFNFGPEAEGMKSVRDLIEAALTHWPGTWVDASDPTAPHEAGLLTLATDKARNVLGIAPRWSFDDTVRATMDWYRTVHQGGDPRAITHQQLRDYGAL